jgi:hypothetical protein
MTTLHTPNGYDCRFAARRFMLRADTPAHNAPGRFAQRLRGCLRSASMAHAQADELSVVAIDRRFDLDPTILLAVGARHIARPPLVRRLSP